MKTCSKCKQSKPFKEFNKHSSNKDGYQYQCKVCRKETNKISYQNRYAKNAERLRSVQREYYWKTHERSLARLKHYRTSLEGKATRSALQSKRKASQLKRTPVWADYDKIKAYYDVCAFFNEVNGYIKYHVDHIVPMQGKNVSGLHVHNNLQVILAQDNMNKYNKYYE